MSHQRYVRLETCWSAISSTNINVTYKGDKLCTQGCVYCKWSHDSSNMVIHSYDTFCGKQHPQYIIQILVNIRPMFGCGRRLGRQRRTDYKLKSEVGQTWTRRTALDRWEQKKHCSEITRVRNEYLWNEFIPTRNNYIAQWERREQFRRMPPTLALRIRVITIEILLHTLFTFACIIKRGLIRHMK